MDDTDYIIGGIVTIVSGIIYFFQDVIINTSNALSLWMIDFAAKYGYIGAFIISVVGNATIILPVPYTLVVFAIAATRQLNPAVLGIVSGFGAALGEVVSYILGRGISMAELERRYGQKFQKIKQLLGENTFWGIFIFGLTPLPDDLIMVPAGIIGYDFKKAIIACASGKIILNIIIALAGFYSVTIVKALFGDSILLDIYVTIIGLIVISYLTIRIDWLSLAMKMKRSPFLIFLESIFSYNTLVKIYLSYRKHPFYQLSTVAILFTSFTVVIISPTYHVMLVLYALSLIYLGVILERKSHN